MQPVFAREVTVDRPRYVLRTLAISAGFGLALSVVVALLPAARHHITYFSADSKTDLAAATIAKYAFEDYPAWVVSHPDRECPGMLAELDLASRMLPRLDPWGHAYHFACGTKMIPRGAVGVWILSAGEDSAFGTADDLRSDKLGGEP